jgi:hypothetical protein
VLFQFSFLGIWKRDLGGRDVVVKAGGYRCVGEGSGLIRSSILIDRLVDGEMMFLPGIWLFSLGIVKKKTFFGKLDKTVILIIPEWDSGVFGV